MTKLPTSTQPAFLAALIRTAYLPVEIPPIITTKYLSRFCKFHYREIKQLQNNLINKSTNYDTFTAPKTTGGRRNLSIVHPVAQIGISLLITQHRKNIRKIISESKASLYDVTQDIDREKAFSGLDFRKRDVLSVQIYSQSQFILNADISRFFYTAYTHSIPWAVLGKEKVKELLITKEGRKKLKAHWSNEIDTALQSCQSRETFGIPVGPDTSRIIAEILLAGVEADKAYEPLVGDRPRLRLLDDFIIGFNEEAEANRALEALRRALWAFNLQLNEEKTFVSQSCTLFREKWRFEFETILVADSNDKKQEHDIYRLIDLTLHLCAVYNTNKPAHWACVRLSNLKNFSHNFKIIFDAMIRFARDFPSCAKHVVAFLINNQDMCLDAYFKSRISIWIKDTLKRYLQHSHDFEVAWCLLMAGVFQIQIEENDIENFDIIPNSVNFTILAMLRERGLLSLPLSKWSWRSTFKSDGVYGPNWLPFYESVLRKWTKDRSLVSAVMGDPILNSMLSQNVTFLEEKIFGAKKIDLSRKTFKPKQEKPSMEYNFKDYVEEDDENKKRWEFFEGYDF